MRTYLITSATVLLLAAPALGQTVTRETTTTTWGTAAPGWEMSPAAPLVTAPAPPPLAAPPAVAPMPGTAYESRSTVQYGDSGLGRTETRVDRYIGTDGALHTDQVIEHDLR
jgi:hypothetical protein